MLNLPYFFPGLIAPYEYPVSDGNEYFVLGLDRTTRSCDAALDRLG
jgi:hypothetical protein